MDNTQAYFWTSDWQEGEREVDEDIRAGRVTRFSSAKDLIAYLHQASSEEEGDDG